MMVRTTLTLDEHVLAVVRKTFNGRISLGVNEMLKEHLAEKNPLEATFGTLKTKKKINVEKLLKESDKEMWGA